MSEIRGSCGRCGEPVPWLTGSTVAGAPICDACNQLRKKHRSLQSARRKSACDGKRAYRSAGDALAAGSTVLRRNRQIRFRAYECPHCWKFHLTTKPERRAQ